MRGNGHFDPRADKIAISKNAPNPARTLQHEMGHFLDSSEGKRSGVSRWLSASGDIGAAVQKEQALLTGRGAAKTAFRNDMKAAMTPGQKYYNNPAVSDIFCSMSKGNIYGNWSHPKAYYKRIAEADRLEVFANLHQLKAAGDTEAIEFVRGFFPETVSAFEKWLYNN
jgi:hypothetical protein